MRWMLDAKCNHMNPDLFDSDNPEPAQLLCSSCPVQPECAEHALTPINVSDFIERFTGVRLDEPDDVVGVSGVKMAGINIDHK